MESIFDTYRTDPEVILPIQEIPEEYGKYAKGEMHIRIGKVGGGTLGKRYRNERWFGELLHSSPLGIKTILHSDQFTVKGNSDHIRAGRVYACMVFDGNSQASAVARVGQWIDMSFEGIFDSSEES